MTGLGRTCSVSVLKIHLATYLLLEVPGFRRCLQAFSGCGEWGLLSPAVTGVSLWGRLSVWSTRSRRMSFSSCGAQAHLPRDARDLPRPGIEPASPARAGGLLATGSQEVPLHLLFTSLFSIPFGAKRLHCQFAEQAACLAISWTLFYAMSCCPSSNAHRAATVCQAADC